jgi:hypothetical protein
MEERKWQYVIEEDNCKEMEERDKENKKEEKEGAEDVKGKEIMK